MAGVMEQIFLVAGGLGLFLFGMKIMSEGLEKIAGNYMRTILEKTTSNRFLGILVGTLVTCIIQSSSATTIMVIGFVNSGLMNLIQAMGVILGAKIGTTLSAQIIAFKFDIIAPLFIFIGIIMYMFFKKRNIKNIGYVILGFGILFFGITVMGMPMEEIAKQPNFQAMLVAFENPFLALLAGLIITSIIQSSSASIGILIAMYLKGVPLPFEAAAFIVIGCNIGTCVDTLIASIPANRESKQAAVSHVLFSIIAGTIFSVILILFPGILKWMQNMWPDGARQVAMFHTIFNIAAVLMFVPFIKQMEKLVKKIIPDKIISEKEYIKKLVYLDDNIMKTPSLAVMSAKKEICRMGTIAFENFSLAIEAFNTKNLEKANKVIENEEIINYLSHNISISIVKIRGLTLSENDNEKLYKMLKVLSDIERIGDHAENIAEYVLLGEKNDIKISPEATEELNLMSELSLEIVKLSINIFEINDFKSLSKVDSLEQQVDDLAEVGIENHIQRLMNNKCDPRSGVIFADMVIELERCSDHATNIAYSIKEETIDKKENKINIKKRVKKQKLKAK